MQKRPELANYLLFGKKLAHRGFDHGSRVFCLQSGVFHSILNVFECLSFKSLKRNTFNFVSILSTFGCQNGLTKR